MIPYNEKKIVDPKCVPVAEPCHEVLIVNDET